MKKNKIVWLISIPVLTICLSTALICWSQHSSIWDVIDYSKLPDWDNSRDLDGNYQYSSQWDYPIVNLSDVINKGDLKVLDHGYVVDFSKQKHNTPMSEWGDTNFNRLKKIISYSAVTGVPWYSVINPSLESLPGYLFGVNDPNKNTFISAWDMPNIENIESKYQTGTQPLVPRDFVASKWVASQDENVKFFSVIQHEGIGALGTTPKGIFFNNGGSLVNFAYHEALGDWAWAPDASEVNIAHRNGVPIYGQINVGWSAWTDHRGYDLKWICEKDKQGHYLFGDLLFNTCQRFNWDGIIFCNEANESIPLDPFLLTEDAQGIIKRFNELAEINHENKKILIYTADNAYYGIQYTWHKFHARMNNFLNNQLDSGMSSVNDGNAIRNYDVTPNQNLSYMAKYPEQNTFNIHNAYFGAKDEMRSAGQIDFRPLAQQHFDPNGNSYGTSMSEMEREYEDQMHNKWILSGHNVNSFWKFDALYGDNNKYAYPKTYSEDVFQSMYAQHNRLEPLYTGKNHALSEDDNGMQNQDGDIPNDASYGVGDLVPEKTVLIDQNFKESGPYAYEFKTNFSTGKGINFVNDDENSNISEIYPWSNVSLADVQPTYMWNIEDPLTHQNQKDIDGYYDWYDPYRKGNSIAIGASYDNTPMKANGGHIIPVEFKNKVLWNIMGTNLSTSDYDVGMKFKITDAKGDPIPISEFNTKLLPKLAITTTELNDSLHEMDLTSNLTPAENGWISFDDLPLTSIGLTNSKIAKIGLTLDPKEFAEYKVNVGELTIKPIGTSTLPDMAPNGVFSRLNSEYKVERNTFNNFQLNAVLKDVKENQIDHYEYYVEIPSDEGLQTIRVGEHWQLGLANPTLNGDKTINYVIQNIPKDATKIIIKTINKYDSTKDVIESWSI